MIWKLHSSMHTGHKWSKSETEQKLKQLGMDIKEREKKRGEEIAKLNRLKENIHVFLTVVEHHHA